MADMQAEDALNNNDMVKRYIVNLQRRKSKKSWSKRLFKFLKCYKKRIFASILCVALITAIFFKIQSETLPPKKPNKTKKHVELKPMKHDHAGKVVNIQEKQRRSEDKIRFMHRTFQYEPANIKQDGAYVNTEQANNMINDALQLYDPDKGGIVDYAEASILATPDTYNLPLSDYEIFDITIICSQPPELITPDVTPEHCFAFWGKGDKQITRLQNNYFTMENAPEAVTGDQKILAPGTFAGYGFEHPQSTQAFAIPKRNQIMAFANVVLRILDNHCHEDFTCVYRVYVYCNPH